MSDILFTMPVEFTLDCPMNLKELQTKVRPPIKLKPTQTWWPSDNLCVHTWFEEAEDQMLGHKCGEPVTVSDPSCRCGFLCMKHQSRTDLQYIKEMERKVSKIHMAPLDRDETIINDIIVSETRMIAQGTRHTIVPCDKGILRFTTLTPRFLRLEV